MAHRSLPKPYQTLALSALFVLFVLESAIGLYQPFNCRRTNVECVHGSCNLNGTCGCESGWQGPDCNLSTASINPSMCVGRECLNGGSCYLDVNVHKCYCPAAYFGNRCEKERVSIKCARGSLEAFVLPYVNEDAGFTGSLYVYNFPNDVNCKFTKRTEGIYQGYGITLPLSGTGACSQGRKSVDDANGNTAYQYEVFVRYNTGITTPVDERHTFTCEFTTDGLLTATISTGFSETDFGSLNGTNVRRGYQPVSLLVMISDTNVVVSAPVSVGDGLHLQFDLPENDIIYSNYRVDSCVAVNTDVNVTTILQEMALLSDSCPDPMAKSVVKSISRSGNTTKLHFDAFKFDDTSLVRFICRISLCNSSNSAACDFNYTSCATNLGSGRRRRQTITQVLKTDVIGQSILVSDGSAEKVVGPNVQCNMAYFYIVLAVLAGFALLTFFCAIYLCFKMARRRRRYDTIVIRKRVMPGGDVVRTVEEVHPAYSNSSDRGPIIRS